MVSRNRSVKIDVMVEVNNIVIHILIYRIFSIFMSKIMK